MLATTAVATEIGPRVLETQVSARDAPLEANEAARENTDMLMQQRSEDN